MVIPRSRKTSKPNMEELSNILISLIGITLAACVYFLPFIIALRRNHSFKFVILPINIIFGITGVGWVVCMV